MNLIFERGDRDVPAGHALIYFRDGEGAILATYVSVPPIHFDLSSYIPSFLAGAMQGMEVDDSMVATPMPPIPEHVDGIEWLVSVAERRRDDLVFAGGTMSGDPMRLASEAVEAARMYGELYNAVSIGHPAPTMPAPLEEERDRLSSLNEQEQLSQLTTLTGRLRESLRTGTPDEEIERQMDVLADVLPPKYRVPALIKAAVEPGDRGQRLAELHLERCYKLYHEDYLDLERIDHEIQAITD